MSAAPRLSMRAITKAFAGITALSDGNLELIPGEVHALMGANGAGKSSLMNVLGGVIAKDGGEIVIDGERVVIGSAAAASAVGIAFVHQELTTMPTLNVAENIFLGDFPRSGPFIARRRMHGEAAELLARVGCTVSTRDLVESLSTGDRQLIEIARAIRKSPRIIILDEPTSSLSGPEREKLFGVIDRLRSNGTAIIFISHFLDEVFRVSDRITVMRNGRTVGTWHASETDMASVVQNMLGSIAASDRVRSPHVATSSPSISVQKITSGPLVRNVSLSLRPGEIVGLWGLLGSGRTELVRSLMGLDPLLGGTIHVADKSGELRISSPAALRAMTGLVTEDRRHEGLILPFSIEQNIGLPNLPQLTNRFGIVDKAKEAALATALSSELGVKSSSIRQAAGTLSGGNQQKVVFSKWLPMKPRIFILDEPTRGLDTGAKGEILKLTVRLAEEGASILFISSELEELMRVSDRYVVINRGSITHELPGSATHDELMKAVSEETMEMGAA